MGKLEPASDPSMEDILASIRRIIADDDGPRRQPQAALHLSVVERPEPQSGPVIREPATPPVAPSARIEANAAPHQPLDSVPMAASSRTLGETVALVAGQPPPVARMPAIPGAAAWQERPAPAVARTDTHAVPPPAPTSPPVAVTMSVVAHPDAAHTVSPDLHAFDAPANPRPRPEPPAAGLQRTAPVSQAAIEIEVARLLASPRPPSAQTRPPAPHEAPAARAPVAPAHLPQGSSAAQPPRPTAALHAPVPAQPTTPPPPSPSPAVAPPHSHQIAVAPAAGSASTTGGAAAKNPALMSPNSDAAVRSAFDQLADTMFSREARSLEDVVKDMMRPMLRDWLDDNLPPLVERLVREEIQRVSRGRK